jgi:Spy/CpxP family protein refolding chaperone
MRKFAALVLAIVMAAPVLAQEKKRPGGGFGMMGGGRGVGIGMLIQNADVQKEIGVSDEQKEKLAEIAKGIQEKTREMFSNFMNMTDEERAEARKKMEAENEKLLKELKPEQLARVKQIQLQQVGVMAFNSPEVAKSVGLSEADAGKIKLSDEQKEKLKEIGDDLRKEMQEMFQGGGFGPDSAKKIQALMKESRAKQAGVLTDEQKKVYADMTGKPFELNLAGFGGGAFGGKDKNKKKKDKDKE